MPIEMSPLGNSDSATKTPVNSNLRLDYYFSFGSEFSFFLSVFISFFQSPDKLKQLHLR